MIRRRQYNNSGGIVLPEKLFCFDFLDETENTNLRVTDSVNGIRMNKISVGTIEFLNEYQGFKRVLRCNTRIANNMYLSTWAQFSNILTADFPNGKPFSIVFFANDKGTASLQSGLFDAYPSGRLIGYQSGQDYLNTIINAPVSKISYSEYSPDDIGLYVMAWDVPTGIKKTSRGETGFSSLLEIPFSGTLTPITGTTTRFLSSQEGYYFAAGGICAGLAIYAGMLTDDQVAYIFNSKQL